MRNISQITIGLVLGLILGAAVTTSYGAFDDEKFDLESACRCAEDTTIAESEAIKPQIPARVPRDVQRLEEKPQKPVQEGDVDLMPQADSQAEVNVRGVLVNESGEAVAMGHYHWTVTFGPQIMNGWVETTADGSFSIPIRGAIHPNEQGKLRLVPGRPSYRLMEVPPPSSQATALLPLKLPRGEVHLGQVISKLLPLVVSGVVVDHNDLPVRGQRVTISVPSSTSDSTPMQYSVRSDSRSGKFEFRLATEAEYVGVKIDRNHFLSYEREVATGSKDLRFSMTQAATLRGSFYKADINWTIELTTADGKTHAAPTTWQGKSGGLSFSFRNVPPGDARLVLRDGNRVLYEGGANLKVGSINRPAEMQNVRL